MQRSRKVLSWVAGTLLVLFAMLLVAVATFDWNRMKPFIGDKVSQAIGRPFAINGALTVDWRRDRLAGWPGSWLPWPEFTARDIRIANPDWAAQPQFAHLDALRFRLSLPALLAHRIEVPTLQLVRPTVDLERDKSGRASWDFALPQSTAPSAWKLQLGTIGFDQGLITLDDAANRVKLQLVVEPLQQAIPYEQIVAQQSSAAREQAGKTAGAAATKAMAGSEATPERVGQATASTVYQFGWTAEGSYQGSPLKGKGRTGAVLALQDKSMPLPLQADLRIGDSHIALVGTLTDPLHLGALDVRLWFSGSSMARLYPITGITLPDTPPYATEGHLKAELHRHGSRYDYQGFRGRVGGSDLAGNLLFVTGGARPKLSGDLHSKLLQFADLAPLIGADSRAGKERRGDATPQPADKLLPVEPFRTDRWQAMDADVTFTGARIVRGAALPIDSLSTHLVMNNGALYLDPLSFSLAGGTVHSNLTLDGSRTPMRGVMKLDARHLKLKQLFPTFEPMRTSFGEINGDAALDAQGNSVAALLGSANGELKLLMNDGAISKTLLETAGLNVANIVIGKLFGDKTVPINCAATDMAATNGLFDMRLFVFDTGDAVINVTGTVNFADEKLDLDVKPHTKGFRVFSLRSPLYVRGTLKDPDVGVHAGPLLARGAGAVALGVVAAPAAALLALVAPSHDDESDNTCRTVLQQLRSSGNVMRAGKTAAKK
ncbi:AsmA family protein [Rhodanobacter denitrificans]|uniref:AsmA family protein n=1 Tax=Rhodanobacter denitrificans TaxID=666685 RepID=A0A368KDE1_9GAMM|nr:AsmA family protein [Rhodanobacter denitrificans]RCS29924.1 AsmA family protein [Rhodanobacter denitrificans]